jgi:outer membrane protein assembly factor BamB
MSRPAIFSRALSVASASVLTLGLALGCASTGYKRAGTPSDVTAALARAKPVAPGRPANAAGRPLAFLVLGGAAEAPRLGAYDLAQSTMLWTQPAELTGRVEVARNAIVHAEKGRDLVGRDIGTGTVVWRHSIPSGQKLIGYAAEADAVYYVAREAKQGVVVGLDAARGGVRWRRTLTSNSVGGPAVRGGLVAVPVQSQYVTLIDGGSGDELAQILSSEEAATFVRALPEGLFFGSRGIFLASGETAGGSRKSVGYLRATLPRFVRPFYHFDMYRPEQTDYSAIDRNRILWRVEGEANGRARFKGGMAHVHNYRFFFGFDARSGDLRWAYNQPGAEAVSSEITDSSILFVTTEGELGALDVTSGRRTYSARIPGVTVRGATFDAEGFSPGGSTLAVGASPAGGDLASALSAIIWDPDRRFSDVKVFAVDRLGRLPGREITEDLLKILQKEGMPPAVYQRTAEVLVLRTDKASIDLYVKFLELRSDYAEGKRVFALDVIAKAVGRLKAKQAAPALIEHLRLPETEPAAVAEISRALGAMQAIEALPALRDFVSIYRADPAFHGDPSALIAVAEAIVTLGGAPERQLLLFVAEEPKTVDALRLHIRRALVQTAVAHLNNPPETSTIRE